VRLLRGSLLLALGLVAAAACSESTAAPTPTPAPTTTTVAPRPASDRFTIGVITPRTGANTELGASIRAGAQLALDDVNAAGGVNGHEVNVVQRDEGDNPAATALAVQDLIQLGVNAIIGPTGSGDVLGTLRTTVRAGILSCSPTASALALDAFPADGLFFRTVPSDSLQAAAIARTVEQTGTDNAALVYLDDAYGRPFGSAVQAALAHQGTGVSLALGVDGSESSLQQAVTTVAAQHPQVIVVVADAASGPGVVAAIDAALTASPPTFVVNDQLRRPTSQAATYPVDLARRVIGVAPAALPPSWLLDRVHRLIPDSLGLFAANAYDCVNVIALAAEAAGSTDPRAAASELVSVTSNGTQCRDFATCARYLSSGRNIDYDGATSLELDAQGRVTSAVFDQFAFDDTGRDVTTGTVSVSAG
jgi:branched-chain amino acid transport system substrate-binding protein